MPRLRRLSGSKVIHILEGFGFTVHAQAGSHVKLRHIGPQGQKQTLTVPPSQGTRYGYPAGHFSAGEPVRSGCRSETSLLHRMSGNPVVAAANRKPPSFFTTGHFFRIFSIN